MQRPSKQQQQHLFYQKLISDEALEDPESQCQHKCQIKHTLFCSLNDSISCIKRTKQHIGVST